MKRILLTLFILTSAVAAAENAQRETSSGWLLNAQTQNWTCNVFTGKTPIGNGTGVGQCKARTGAAGEFRQHLGFAYANPVKVTHGGTSRYYFYVQEWGAVEGPGSECSGDSVMIFEVPYTANGATANGVTPIYRGTANPCNTAYPHWAFASAMFDPLTGGVTLTGQRNLHDTVAEGAFTEAWIAESKPAADGTYGRNFTWKKLFGTAIAGHAVLSLHVVPDADGKTWRGFLENIHPDDPNNPYDGGWGATPVIINRAQGTLQYRDSPNTWVTVPQGGNITALPWLQYQAFISSFTKVNGRYELWFDTAGLSSGNQPMSPCDGAKYTWNTKAPPLGGLDRGGANNLKYVVVDANLNPISVTLPLQSDTHPIPSDERFSVTGLRASNIVGLPGSTIYYGSNDWAVCNINLTNWGHWSGSGIRWGRLVNE